MPVDKIALTTLIFTAGQFGLGLKQLAEEPAPGLEDSLKSKARWMSCTLYNETQFEIDLIGTHFDSGRYYKAPAGVGPFKRMDFTVCDKDNSIMTGASGGTSFKLKVQDGKSVPFSLGWTSPYIGDYKAGAVFNMNAEEGYKSAGGTGCSIQSAPSVTFEGKDKDGNKRYFYIRISAAPGAFSSYTVTQDFIGPAEADTR